MTDETFRTSAPKLKPQSRLKQILDTRDNAAFGDPAEASHRAEKPVELGPCLSEQQSGPSDGGAEAQLFPILRSFLRF